MKRWTPVALLCGALMLTGCATSGPDLSQPSAPVQPPAGAGILSSAELQVESLERLAAASDWVLPDEVRHQVAEAADDLTGQMGAERSAVALTEDIQRTRKASMAAAAHLYQESGRVATAHNLLDGGVISTATDTLAEHIDIERDREQDDVEKLAMLTASAADYADTVSERPKRIKHELPKPEKEQEEEEAAEIPVSLAPHPLYDPDCDAGAELFSQKFDGGSEVQVQTEATWTASVGDDGLVTVYQCKD